MGLGAEQAVLERSALESLIKWYCRESGVRNLQKHINKVGCRVDRGNRVGRGRINNKRVRRGCQGAGCEGWDRTVLEAGLGVSVGVVGDGL